MYNPIDQGAIIRAGMELVPDYNETTQRQLLNNLTRLQIASGRQEMDFNAQKVVRDQQRQADYVAAVTALGANPTHAAYRDLALRFPEQHQAISATRAADEDHHTSKNVSMIGEMIAAGRNGRWDLASKTAERWIDAEARAGQADDNDYEMLRMMREGDDEERAQLLGLLTHRLATSVGGKHTAEMWNAVFDEDRDREIQPFRVREQAAKADTAEAEADNASSYYAGRAREQVADAEVAESNSAWQEAKNAVGVAKSGAQLANVRSLIAKRAAALGKSLGEVTPEDMRQHYRRKRSKGIKLTPSEQKAEPVFAPKAKPAPGARAPAQAKPAPVIVNPKTGQRMTLRNGKWVPIP